MTSRGIRTLVFSTVFLWTTLSWALPLSLDQFYIPASDPREGVVIEVTETVAQTFTIGVGGLLTAVEIELRCCQHGTPSADLLVEIRTTLADGAPSDNVLATAVLRSKHLPIDSFEFIRVRFAPDRVFVLPGEMYAIVLSTTAAPLPPGGDVNPYAWGGDGVGLYDRGLAYFDRGTGFLPLSWDMGFKVYVRPAHEEAEMTFETKHANLAADPTAVVLRGTYSCGPFTGGVPDLGVIDLGVTQTGPSDQVRGIGYFEPSVCDGTSQRFSAEVTAVSGSFRTGLATWGASGYVEGANGSQDVFVPDTPIRIKRAHVK